MMLRLIKDNPLKALEFLKKNSDKFSVSKRIAIREQMMDKLEIVISYLAEFMSNLYKVKLMKSLWYTDSLAYKETGKAMMGLVYRHEPMGALPIGHYSLMNLENLNIKEEMSYNYDSMLHVYPSKYVDYSILTLKEKDILDRIIKKFKNFKASEIVKYMHEEKVYQETVNGAIIPFSLAREIRDFE